MYSKCLNLFFFQSSLNEVIIADYQHKQHTFPSSTSCHIQHAHTQILKNYYKAPKCGKYLMSTVRRGRGLCLERGGASGIRPGHISGRFKSQTSQLMFMKLRLFSNYNRSRPASVSKQIRAQSFDY